MAETVQLTKEIVTDHLIEGATGRTFVIDRTRYLDANGELVAEEVHRRPIEPGADVSGESDRTRALIEADASSASRPSRPGTDAPVSPR